jgi:hypothetical protein
MAISQQFLHEIHSEVIDVPRGIKNNRNFHFTNQTGIALLSLNM